MHAILFRKWKTRIKGRAFYDLLWYLGQGIPLNLEYLENKMRDGNAWAKTDKLTRDDLIKILETRIGSIDFKNAALDVTTFIKDPLEVAEWSSELFLSAIKSMKTE